MVQFHKTPEVVFIHLFCVISGYEISEGKTSIFEIMIFRSQYYLLWFLSNAIEI